MSYIDTAGLKLQAKVDFSSGMKYYRVESHPIPFIP